MVPLINQYRYRIGAVSNLPQIGLGIGIGIVGVASYRSLSLPDGGVGIGFIDIARKGHSDMGIGSDTNNAAQIGIRIGVGIGVGVGVGIGIGIGKLSR